MGFQSHAVHESSSAGAHATAQEIAWLQDRFERVVANVEDFVQGKDAVVRLALTCLLAEGHILIEDVPGVGKTVLAKVLSASCEASHARVQFTPDLLPADVTGTLVYDQGAGDFRFHPGPAFCNILLGDEINRASPKTQSALLEVMEERQITVDGDAKPVPRPLMVIATQNPIELSGTYALPEAQVDRFMAKFSVGYPSHDAEVRILNQRTREHREDDVPAVVTIADLSRMSQIVRRVFIAPAVAAYIVTLVSATRRLPEVRLGVSPRGGVALVQAAQAWAATHGRTFVTADDVKALAGPVLAHRLILMPEAELQGTTGQDLVAQVLAQVPVPAEPVGV
ncbi:MAG: MoxR family ATPase [Dermatophilaceae bacterium]